MSSFADERAAIEKRFKDNWTTTPIAFDNVGFRPTDSEYVAIFIQNASATQIELTGTTPSHRYTGLFRSRFLLMQTLALKLQELTPTR